jgi:GWxTD domain-containing protein
MRRPSSFASLLLLLASAALAASLPELFVKAKEQFKLGNYKESLATVETLDSESSKPGMEAERQKILPGILFYKGANLAALGRSDEAEEAFEGFLERAPTASLDPALYPPRVIAAFDAARKSLDGAAEKTASSAPAETGVLSAAYRAFRPPDSKPEDERDWSAGPAKYLLTPAEKADFERLTDFVARSEFIAIFWKSRDPKPETPENEFREEFEKRVAFADARFTQDEVRGSLTDRGMVFVLVGPPTYNGQRPLNASRRRFDDEPPGGDAARVRGGHVHQPGRVELDGELDVSEGGSAEGHPLYRAQDRVRHEGRLRQGRAPARSERRHGDRARQEEPARRRAGRPAFRFLTLRKSPRGTAC